MIVSQFTVSFGLQPAAQAVDSRFYRLLITNLATESRAFRITVTSSDEGLDKKVAYVLGEWDWIWRTPLTFLGQRRYGIPIAVEIDPNETCAITLGPWQQQESPLTVRGYVDVSVPETYMKTEEGHLLWPILVEASQGTAPVPVLLHPSEVHGAWGSRGYVDGAPITVSTGRAENVIVPDKPPKWEVSKGIEMAGLRWNASATSEKQELSQDISAFVEDPFSIQAVVAYLGRVGASAENVDALNALLSETGHPVRLTTRNR